MQALRMGRMKALKKAGTKVRGIVAGSVLRRVVCRALAMQYGDVLLEATAPYEFALQTRAGTDAIGHVLRYLTDNDPDA
eukprot:12352557-Karenia_brevis.AAC.1